MKTRENSYVRNLHHPCSHKVEAIHANRDRDRGVIAVETFSRIAAIVNSSFATGSNKLYHGSSISTVPTMIYL